MSAEKLRILDVGCGSGTAELVFRDILEGVGEYEVVKLDINPGDNPDVVHDIRKPFPPELIGKFDLVLASHVLEHVERFLVEAAVHNIAETLAYMGELWIVVPSMEWVAEQIMANRFDADIWQCIYGGGEPNMPNYYYHHQGYTLMMLRIILQREGLTVRRAYHTPFKIRHTGSNGNEVVTEGIQNVVIGAKMTHPVEIIG